MSANNELTIEMAKIEIAMAKEARRSIEELNLSPMDDNVHELPPNTWDGYEDDDDVEKMMDLGEQLADTPWGTNCWGNKSFYIAGTGHNLTVKPKYEDESPSSKALRNIQRFMNDWMQENQWTLRQSEVSRRLDTYGECFDTVIFEEDGMTHLQFGESVDVYSDPMSEFNAIINDPGNYNTEAVFRDEFGVRRTNDIKYRRIGYYLGDNWYRDLGEVSTKTGIDLSSRDYDESKFDSDTAILHRVRNLGMNANRGRTFFFPVREELVYAKRIIANVMRVSSFQAAIGAIRQLTTAAAADQMRAWARAQENASSNGQNDQIDVPAPGVITTGPTVRYEFPETGRGLVNHMEVLVGTLRTCASGLMLPEFMLTANVSEGNFASTLVSEGPFHKFMQFSQSQMIMEDERIYWAALRHAAQAGRFGFSLRDLLKIKLEVRPPRVQTRNRKEDFDIASVMNDKGLLSNKTLVHSEQYDYESEQAQRSIEIGNELPLPMGSTLAMKMSQPGPQAKPNADPMKEPGVSKGNPENRIAK